MKFAALLTLLVVVLALVVGTVGFEKPTRSECIVGYALNWSKVNEDTERNKLHIPPHVRAALFITIDGSRLYLQFRENCKNKDAMAEALIDYWRKSGVSLPEFTRIEGEIVPSPRTIDVRGPSWRD